MLGNRPRGLFISGTDTGVGKTYVAALIARSLRAAGHRVGVYKPAASGCELEHGALVSDDAVALWNAAGQPGELDRVCPQQFAAPLAPHLAARAEGRTIDKSLLVAGLDYWIGRSDVTIVEGAGGLFSPIDDDWLVAHLAAELGFPIVIVARDGLGTLHQTIATLKATHAFAPQISVAGVVLNSNCAEPDLSTETNAGELVRWIDAPLLARVEWNAREFSPAADWFGLAQAEAKKP
jgi:dethiobiotin synthetase